MAEAATALSPAPPLALPPRRRGARERRLTAAAAVFTLVGGSAGLAAAAQSSLPGEALYPIKRGIEDAQLRLQSEPDGRGRVYLDQASARLDEATELIEDGGSETAVAEVVDDFVVQAVAGADLLLGSYEDGQAADADVEVVREFAADAVERLQQLAERAPEVQQELARAVIVLQRIDQQASAACSECSDLPALELPELMAQAAEISRAMEAVRAGKLDNDHGGPLAVDGLRDKVRKAPDSTAAADETPLLPDGEQATGGKTELGVSEPRLRKDGEETLKRLDDATGGLLGGVTETTEKSVKSVTDGVKDVRTGVEQGLTDSLGSTLDGSTD
jgi:hypothetical protein